MYNQEFILNFYAYKEAEKSLNDLGVDEIPSSFKNIPILSMFMKNSTFTQMLMANKFKSLIPEESKKESIDKRKKDLEEAGDMILTLTSDLNAKDQDLITKELEIEKTSLELRQFISKIPSNLIDKNQLIALLPVRFRTVTLPTQDNTPSPTIGINSDLQVINGIGATYEQALLNAGVFTITDVKSKTAAELQSILDDAGISYSGVNFADWKNQAGTLIP